LEEDSMTTTTDLTIRPFEVHVPEEDLADLQRRIAATRWPHKELVADRSQGVQLATIQELARYWEADYDWRACEAKLNALPQFKTEIDGVDIHFIHVKSPHADALPLVITHGWPGSVIELLGVVGPLTDPAAHGGRAEDAFDLVLPSLPGYGFSGQPAEAGWNPGRVAQAWAELMHRLGYTRYVAQGGDAGASVTDAMGRQAPQGLAGIHMNLLVTALGGGAMPSETEQERAALEQTKTFRSSGFGYFLEQATRPQTIGYALLDSAAALAAWMLDHDTDAYYKISRAFVDGQPSGGLTRDHIPRQHHCVLADRHRDLGGPVVLGERTSPGSRGGCRAGSSRGLAPGRLHHVPRRDLPGPAQLGREVVPQPHLLQRGRQGRPLRRLGRARAVRGRDPGGVQPAALTTTKGFGWSAATAVRWCGVATKPSGATSRDGGGARLIGDSG
jgi:pimeloyl-ACP methyl ester carboxylesterase